MGSSRRIPRVLAIAGSDSGEGVGPGARPAVVERRRPGATGVTPNVAGARKRAEAGGRPGAPADLGALVRTIHGLGPRYVVVPGGDREDATALFFDGEWVTP